MPIAFFDLDKTLLSLNSGKLWLRRELREGQITHFQAARAGLWLLRYHFGFASIEAALLQAIGTLKGSDAKTMRERTRRFYELDVRACFRSEAITTLEAHREQGDELVLLTSSTGYLSECVQEDLALDGILCTQFETDAEGRHTGEPRGEMCFGAGKLTHAERYAKAREVRLEDCSFYTDSIADLPVLQKVGRPVVVNPDRRLRAEALRQGWPVVDWGQASAEAYKRVKRPAELRATG